MTWALLRTRAAWVSALTIRFRSLLWLPLVEVTIPVVSLTMVVCTEVVVSAPAGTTEAEARVVQASLACPLALPARCLQASHQPRLVTRLPRLVLPALVSPQHHQDTWLRLHPRTTRLHRLDTAHPHHRRTRPHLLLATPRRRLNTLPHRPTTAQRPQRSWVARRPPRTARLRHNTVPHRRSTVPQAPSTKRAATGSLRLHPRRRNTARRLLATRPRVQQAPSHLPPRATALPLRAERTLLHLQSNSWLDGDVGIGAFFFLSRSLLLVFVYENVLFLLSLCHGLMIWVSDLFRCENVEQVPYLLPFSPESALS